MTSEKVLKNIIFLANGNIWNLLSFGDNISAKNEAMQKDMVMTPIWQQRLMIAKLADAS